MNVDARGVVQKKARTRRDTDWEAGGQPPLPPWLEARDYQVDAVEQIVKEFEAGARVVQLDAPTGTGKTAIADLVRRQMQVTRGLYVCTTKSLQHQVAHDFSYARVLKGRANYTPNGVSSRQGSGYRQGDGGLDGYAITCRDCDRGPAGVPEDEQTCSYCPAVEDCPYLVARGDAVRAPMGVLNTSYLLAEGNTRGSRFAGRELVVMDEADLIERELLGYVELRIGSQVAKTLGVEVPKKGSHLTTIRGWLGEEVLPAIKARTLEIRGGGLEARRARSRLAQLQQDVTRVVEREDGWVRDNDEEDGRGGAALVLKPVSVEDVGDRYLWRHADRWLLMSGTTVSAEMQADALGIEEADIPWASVEVESQFAAENRRVVYVPAGTMTRKGQEAGGKDKVLRALERVLERHPTGNVLVHTFSYQLAKETIAHLKGKEALGGREVITYLSARDRDRALGMFKAAARNKGAVLVASSMDRGIDLPGELCRVQVVMKVPMASLGDRQVSERLHSKGGELWYLVETVRTVMQMCGRAVRGRDDWATTYVLDQHFSKTLKDGKRMGLWPAWWLEGLKVGKVREYL